MTWIEARHRDACSVCAGRKAHEFGYLGNWRDMRFLTLGEVEDNLWHYANDGARVAHTYAEYIALQSLKDVLSQPNADNRVWINAEDRFPGKFVHQWKQDQAFRGAVDSALYEKARTAAKPLEPNAGYWELTAAADRLAAEMETGLKDKHQYAEC